MASKSKGVIDCFVSVATTLDSVDDTTKKFLTASLRVLKKHYTNYELIIVANGLQDDAVEDVAELLKEYPCIRIIRLSRKYNQEVATFAAIESAIGDYVVVASAENDPPASIVHMVGMLREDHNDIVFGVSKTPLPYPFLAKLGRKWFFWYSGHFLEVNIPVNTTYLMSMNRRAINALTQIKGHHRHIRHISAQVGFKTATYQYNPKFKGLVGRGFVKSANLALEIAVSYSRHPLRLLSKISLIVSLINVGVAVYTVATYLLRDGHVAEGWTTLTLEMSVMFFFVFLMLAVIAEYIGQIREEMRDQPPYHIMEELTSNVLIADETRRNITKQ